MKKLLLLISLFGLVMGLNSCEKFLEEHPRSERSTEVLFKSRTDAYSAVNILYRKGFPTFHDLGSANGSAFIMYGGFLAGLFDNQYKGEGLVRMQMQQVDANQDNGTLEIIWQRCYEVIARNINFALKYIPDCPGLSNEERNMLIAEVKFFRALNYFHLVKMFGAVPLITHPYESLNDIYVRRSTEDKVYALIVQDLTEALNNGGLADKPMPENNFRVSKGSVAALLADVYLTMAGYPLNDVSQYANAATIAKSLINNANYALIENVNQSDQSAYNILRTSDDEKEYLYSVEYDGIISTGGAYPMFCFPQEATSWSEFPRYPMANLGYNPIPMLHLVYDQVNDLRYQEHQYFHSSYTQVNEPNAGTVRTFNTPIPYFWWEPTSALETGVCTKDRVHYRLTEMYLIAAEAIVKSGNSVTEEAAIYLATIQYRASLNKSLDEIKTELMALSPDEFIKEVWREKIREFIFESKIWNDITRTRMYPVVDGNGKFDFVNLIGTTNYFGGTYSENKLYLPIGSLEMQRNPALSEPPL